MAAVPVVVLVLVTYSIHVQIHTNPQVVVQRLPLRLARISPSTQQRFLLTLPARSGCVGRDTGCRSHVEKLRSSPPLITMVRADGLVVHAGSDGRDVRRKRRW